MGAIDQPPPSPAAPIAPRDAGASRARFDFSPRRRSSRCERSASAPPSPALGEQHGEFGGALRLAVARRLDHHSRQPGRERQRPHGAAHVGEPTVVVERPEFAVERDRLLPGGRRRRIEPFESPRIAHPPGREIKGKPGQIGVENFGRGEGRERRRLRLVPQAIADAGLGAAGAAAALIDAGARGAHGLEPRQSEIRLEALHTRQPAVDDDAHAFDGERGFRDRCGEHDLATAGPRRRDGEVLLAAIERAIERRDVDVVRQARLGEARGDAHDLALPRQKGEDRASLFAQRPHDRARHRLFDTRIGVAAEITRLDGKCAPLALDRSCAPISAATRAPSSVADMAMRRRSSRSRSARRAPARGRDRRRASVRDIRRTARRRRPRAPGRRGSSARTRLR